MAASAFLHPAVLATWARGSAIRVRRAAIGHQRHGGDAKAIIEACLDRCWTGRHLTASPGHYRQFWTRDLGFSSAALVRLGQGERVRTSLDWAIATWRRRRSHVTTTIHRFRDWPSDLFDYGVDSLPLLFASLRASGADEVVDRHRDWLADEVRHYVARVVDPVTGLVRRDRHFSAHRDTFKNGSNAYANTMVALLAKLVAETGWGPDLLGRHFPRGDWGRLLREHFWAGDRFRDRLDHDGTSGEANVFPFFAGVVEDRTMMSDAFATLEATGHTKPFPLRFESEVHLERVVLANRLMGSDYQTTTAWTSLGGIYLSLLREVDRPAAEAGIAQLVEVTERDGTFWEVLDDSGRCWRSRNRLSIGEEAMLWSSVFLDALVHPTKTTPRLGLVPVAA